MMKTKISQCKTEIKITGIAVAFLVLFAGCSFAPTYVKPDVHVPATFKEQTPEQSVKSEDWKAAEPKDDTIRGKWWELFHEQELNALEEQVAVSNQNIAAALANFLAARAVVKQNRSQYFPTVTAAPSIARLQQSSLLTPSSSLPAHIPVNEYMLPFDASWEPDFWGRIRNATEASTFEEQATLADLENVRLTIQAEVAADYFQLRVLDMQKQLLDSAALAYQESLKLTQDQYNTGLGSDQDIAQAETQLTITRAQDIDLGIQHAQLEHAVATLFGKPDSSFSIATHMLAANPPAIPSGVPSQLLERRADIAAAERRVAEANAQIGVARAAFYPNITLSGSLGFQSTSLANLFSAPGFVWSVGTSLAQTLFDGGKRSAVSEQSRAMYQSTVANYRQTVLIAFQEAEDNLSTLRILSQERQQQDAAVESSQRYLRLAIERYKTGIDSYLNVVTAQTTLLTNQRTAMNLRMQQMTTSVQLIKALGGSWSDSRKPQESMP